MHLWAIALAKGIYSTLRFSKPLPLQPLECLRASNPLQVATLLLQNTINELATGSNLIKIARCTRDSQFSERKCLQLCKIDASPELLELDGSWDIPAHHHAGFGLAPLLKVPNCSSPPLYKLLHHFDAEGNGVGAIGLKTVLDPCASTTAPSGAARALP